MRPTSILYKALPSSITVVLGFAGLAAFTPTHAATGDLYCNFHEVVEFSPPLNPTNLHSTVTIVGKLSNCTSSGKYSRLTSGSYLGSGTAVAKGDTTCSLPSSLLEGGTITWNTGEQSTFNSSFNGDTSRDAFPFLATINSGPLTGNKFVVVPMLTPNADCDQVGVTRLEERGIVMTT